MRRKIIGSIFCTVSVPVMAQSAVTIYGVVDEGINYTNNVDGHSLFDLQSGFAQGSRWGFKGVEDLGWWDKGVFQPETDFNVSTGRLARVDYCLVGRPMSACETTASGR